MQSAQSFRAAGAERCFQHHTRRARKLRMHISANTLWTLQPDPKWCAKPEHKEMCSRLAQVDLTGVIGTKRLCSVASHDHPTEDVQDLCILDHGGVHLVFEAEGTANPLDSPSRLFVTDVDSTCDVMLDGTVLPKGQRTRAKPGSTLCMGSEASYVVLRNVFAHA